MKRRQSTEPTSTSTSIEQVKQRLGEMRQRARQLLDKHDWQGYLLNNSNLSYSNSSCDEEYTTVATSKNDDSMLNLFSLDDGTSAAISAISLLEYDSIFNRENTNPSNQTMMMNSMRIMKRVVKKQTTCKECVMIKPVLMKRQAESSLTFIADLASTSTPTKQPIVSTPKARNHDPAKYHPTQTIRNKLSKKKKVKQQQVKQQQQQLDAYLYTASKKRVMSAELVSCRCCQNGQHAAKHQPVVKKRRLSSTTTDRVNCSMCDLVVSSITNGKDWMGLMKKRTCSSNGICSVEKRVKTVKKTTSSSSKKVATSLTNRITLRDLMYTPAKLRSHHHQQQYQQAECSFLDSQCSTVLATNMKLLPTSVVTKSTAPVASKVYYL